MKSNTEHLLALLDEQQDKLLKFEINLEFFSLMVEENPKDEKFLKQKGEQEIAISRQKKMLDIIKARLEVEKQNEASANTTKE